MQSFVVIVYFAIINFALVNCAMNLPLRGRIVGGQDVNIDKCPYQVSVRAFDTHICGGIIIAVDTILTAAHCTQGWSLDSLSIRHGSNYADYGKEHVVTRIIQNPDFDAEYNENDSSLLKISPVINYTRSSQAAILGKKRSADNSAVFICGWGVHYEDEEPVGGVGKRNLQAVTLRVVKQEACKRAYHSPRIDGTLMCAAAKGKDSCQGDSGGGLVDMKTGAIIGISSWGQGCATNQPGVYGSIPDMMEFIEPNMKVIDQIIL